MLHKETVSKIFSNSSKAFALDLLEYLEVLLRLVIFIRRIHGGMEYVCHGCLYKLWFLDVSTFCRIIRHSSFNQ